MLLGRRKPSIDRIGRLAHDRSCCYPPGKPAEKESAQDVEGVMDVLDQQEEGHAKSDQNGQPFIHPAGQTEIKQKYSRSMSREEEVFGDKFGSIEKIAQWIYQADEAYRGIQRHKVDGQHPENAKHDKRPGEGQEHSWVLDSADRRQRGKGPDNDKEGNRNIMSRDQL